jgi:hypothetical protein
LIRRDLCIGYQKNYLPLPSISQDIGWPGLQLSSITSTILNQHLNLHDLKKLGVKWYIAYAKGDDLVEKEGAIAAVPYLKDEDVLEVTEFPGGHVGILTSFAGEDSKFPLDGEFNGLRGPVHFHLSLQEAALRPSRLHRAGGDRDETLT